MKRNNNTKSHAPAGDFCYNIDRKKGRGEKHVGAIHNRN